MKHRHRGYILIETLTAMAILSITALTVQRAIQVAIQARGLAQDYTTAQFLLENLVADQTLQPRIAIGTVDSGTFPPPNERFQYAWSLDEVAVPLPALDVQMSVARDETVEQRFLNYMGKLQVEISWSRGGQALNIAGETLLSPDQAWRDSSVFVP